MNSPLARFLSRVALSLLPAALALAAGAAAYAAPPGGAPSPPNIVLLYMDNVGYGDLGCYGNAEIKTPHIDRIASEAVRCTQFYIGSPSCTPSRGAILTGRHPERTGLNWQLKPDEQYGIGLPLSEKLIPQFLKPLGYATACFGKWNIGFGEGAQPTDRGFDQFFGHASGNINYYTHRYHSWNDMRRGSEAVDLRGQYATDLFADAAIEFIHQHKQGPFFVYVPFNAPHFPGKQNFDADETPVWQAPEKFMAMYGLSGRTVPVNDQRGFYAVMSAMDDAIGRIDHAVTSHGLSDNTLFIILSDNGAFLLPDRGLGLQSNAPFRDGGVTLYEGGIRVPCLIRWPVRFEGGSQSDAMLTSMDLLPMFLSAASKPVPSDLVLDGRDPTAALANEAPSPHDQLGWVWRDFKAFRRGDWKIIQPPPASKGQPTGWELYNLAKDPAESINLADQHPDLLAELENAFTTWHTQIKRPADER